MYPLLLTPLYKERVWGGNKLKENLNRDIPCNRTGESWDISCREDEMGVVENGYHKGKSFADVLNTDRKKYIGEMIAEAEAFPLLIKIIDAQDNLSIQVHPDDAYARLHEADASGKNEMWYILDAPTDAYLWVGVKKETNREMFRRALLGGTLLDCIEKLAIKKGDVIHIPAGLLHAITKDVMVLEVQQNADVTYRIYDYDRLGLDNLPRALHVEQSLDVLDFDSRLPKKTTKGLQVKEAQHVTTYYIADPYFGIIAYDIEETLPLQTDGQKFMVLTAVEGDFTIQGAHFEDVTLAFGRSAFIPAALGQFCLTGRGKIIKSFVPNIADDFITPLLQSGFTQQEIRQNLSF